MPLITACVGAAAIVVVLAYAVLPADADPKTSTPTPTGIALATNGLGNETAPEPTDTATAASRTVRDLTLDNIPTPTPRVIRRPKPSPTAEPTRSVKTVALADQELVANGEFEAFDSSWYLEQGAVVTTGDAHDGSSFLLIDTSGGYADQRVTVEVDVTYQVSIWAKVSDAGTEAPQIGVRYEDGRYNAVAAIDPIQITVNDRGWTNVAFTFTPPDGAARALISFWNPPGNGSLSIDDVSIRALVAE